MKTLRHFLCTAAIVGFASSSILISGCKKNKDENKAPAIPPQSGFVMSFNDFSNSGGRVKSTSVAAFQNWGYSYLNVAAWNVMLTVQMAVPVASFAEVFNHAAVYHPDAANWTWSYNFNANNIPYEAELTGAIVADSVLWQMRITKGTEYAKFLWYYGSSDIAQTGGYWILKENPSNSNNLIRIDWNKKTNAIATADIRYTNIKPGSSDRGSYIFAGTEVTNFDRFYHIYSSSLANLTEIEWSSTLKNGHVRDPHHYTDTNFHCWDTNLIDIVCP